MEFYKDDKVIVNPLRIHPEYMHELENNLVLYFTATSRESATIIKEQVKNVKARMKKHRSHASAQRAGPNDERSPA